MVLRMRVYLNIHIAEYNKQSMGMKQIVKRKQNPEIPTLRLKFNEKRNSNGHFNSFTLEKLLSTLGRRRPLISPTSMKMLLCKP